MQAVVRRPHFTVGKTISGHSGPREQRNGGRLVVVHLQQVTVDHRKAIGYLGQRFTLWRPGGQALAIRLTL